MPLYIQIQLILLLSILFGSIAHAESAPIKKTPLPESKTESQNVLVIGATTDNYPYSFLDEKGELRGFAVDLTDAIMKAMNMKARRVAAPAKELHHRFTNGEFDLLQVYSQTDYRETYADFTAPYLHLTGALFITRHPRIIKQVSDLDGRDFAIIGEGSIGEKFLADRKLAARIVYVTSGEQALRWVDSGRVAAVFVSQLTALSVIERVGLKNVVMWDQPISDYDVHHCMAVHENDSALLSRLNEGLWILNQRGEYSAIYNKWFGHITSPVFTREQLVRYTMAALAVGLAIATLALVRQLILSRRIARQAAELREQRELLHALYDNVPTGLTVIQDDGKTARVVSLNREAARIYGLESHTNEGGTLTDLGLSPEVSSHLETVIDHARKRHFQRREYTLPSRSLMLDVIAVPLSNEKDPVFRFCIFAADITERKRLDAEIAQSRKLLAVGELVGGIAHEFNNLLTPILFTVSELQSRWKEDSELQEEVGLIAQASKRAADLTRRLLTFGRRGDGKMEPVHLGQAVEGSCALLRPTMDRRIIWEIAMPQSLPPVLFNSTDIHQMLLNLMLNARDTLMDKLAAPHDEQWQPRISVSLASFPPEANTLSREIPTRHLLGWQRLVIKDNGKGIPPQVLDRIFDPFFTTKEVGKGTGLGLATVWHLISNYGGRVEVDTTVGEGSSFHLWIPVWPVPNSPDRAPRATTPVNSAAVDVLLVEDENMVARTLINALQREGHRVRHIIDGAEAWNELSVNIGHYTLLVIDNNLPGMSGLEIIDKARNHAFAGRIVVMSGRVSDGDHREFRQRQVDGVIAKPFDIAQFIELIRRVLQNGGDPK